MLIIAVILAKMNVNTLKNMYIYAIPSKNC